MEERWTLGFWGGQGVRARQIRRPRNRRRRPPRFPRRVKVRLDGIQRISYQKCSDPMVQRATGRTKRRDDLAKKHKTGRGRGKLGAGRGDKRQGEGARAMEVRGAKRSSKCES